MYYNDNDKMEKINVTANRIAAIMQPSPDFLYLMFSHKKNKKKNWEMATLLQLQIG